MKKPVYRQMDLSDRLVIEIGLSVHDSFKKIAKDLGRHPSTITKEIRENRYFLGGYFFMGNDCRKARECQRKRHMCGDEKCLRTCIACRKWYCREHCEHYVRRHCKRPDEPPYVCNTCSYAFLISSFNCLSVYPVNSLSPQEQRAIVVMLTIIAMNIFFTSILHTLICIRYFFYHFKKN